MGILTDDSLFHGLPVSQPHDERDSLFTSRLLPAGHPHLVGHLADSLSRCFGLETTHIQKQKQMIAPRIADSDCEERIAFIRERFRCKAPACGGCRSCRMPNGKPAMETFDAYIRGEREFASIAAELWKL